MDFALFAQVAAPEPLSPWIYWPMVVLGLGMVIFIHELGHFLVAKWCGVRCDKFYVGFDVPISIPIPFTKKKICLPAALWKRKWGETEYGIGILPLGGYVKMLGQDDNPYRAREEMEKARLSDAPGTPSTASEAEPAYQLDPRSYIAKSVPQRMAIISAGVVMNLILAFVVSVVAYSMGVRYTPAVVGSVQPGSAAWDAEIPIGADIVRVNDELDPTFRDFRKETLMNDDGVNVEYTYLDPATGEKKTRDVTVHPREDKFAEFNFIQSAGIEPASGTTLSSVTPVAKDSAADRSQEFQGGDKIVAVESTAADGQAQVVPVESYAQMHEQFVRHATEWIWVHIQRAGQPQPLRIKVGPSFMRRLGLVMQMGPIVGIQDNSPATKAGLEVGDRIIGITPITPVEGVSFPADHVDPILMPEQLRRLAEAAAASDVSGAGQVKITVVRKDHKDPLELGPVSLRVARWAELPKGKGQPVSAPALGIAYRVINVVQDVEPTLPAAGKVEKGAMVKKIVFRLPEGEIDPTYVRFKDDALEEELELGDDEPHWPHAELFLMQQTPPGTEVGLLIKGQDEIVWLTPAIDDRWHNPSRGFLVQQNLRIRQASTFGEALSLGWKETVQSTTMVVEFLQRIGKLWRGAGGPITIVRVAGDSAKAGFPDFLIFIAMLSANLAVINALPIPVLDGGHFMFLLYEGIFRKPPSEKVFVALTFLGFAFILGLMALVIGLDISRL